jgi:hypothetical protein
LRRSPEEPAVDGVYDHLLRFLAGYEVVTASMASIICWRRARGVVGLDPRVRLRHRRDEPPGEIVGLVDGWRSVVR